jgi:hypothetical protein
LPQAGQERRHSGLTFWIVRSECHEHADAPHTLARLLRARRERPRRRSAAERG